MMLQPKFSDNLNSVNNSIENEIALNLFVDAAKFSNSTNKSYWAMLASISNLPPLARNSFQNILKIFLLSASNFGLEYFLTNYLGQFSNLISNGINVEGLGKIKIRVISFISDLPALAKMTNSVQFNGEFGCIKCYNKGIYLPEFHKRVFVFN